MKEITNLIKLDFICLKRKVMIPAIILILFVTTTALLMGPIMAVPMVAFSGLFIYPMFNIAAKNEFDKLYGTLPINRSKIVLARFLSGYIAMFLMTLFMFIIAEITLHVGFYENLEGMRALKEEITPDTESLLVLFSVVYLLGCTISAIEYTLIWIFGVEKEAVSIIGFGIILGVIIWFICGVLKIDILNKILMCLNELYLKSNILFFVVMFVMGIAVMAALALLTNAITRKREL